MVSDDTPRTALQADNEEYCDKMCNLMMGMICLFVFMGALLLMFAHLLNERRGGNAHPS